MTLALGVVMKAFSERPNFYSAAVYLSQSNACLMVGLAVQPALGATSLTTSRFSQT